MTVDVYLDATPEPQRSTLIQLRAMLASILPEAEEGISYGVPAFMIGGKAVAGYAAAKRHCSYFPHSGSVISQIEPELLEGYDWAKGTLRFPIDTVPEEALIRRLVEIRLTMLEKQRETESVQRRASNLSPDSTKPDAPTYGLPQWRMTRRRVPRRRNE